MKIFKHIGLLAVLLAGLTACQEKVTDPTFGKDEMPYIYMDWAGTFVYNIGDVMEFTAQVAPSNETECRWLIDGEIVSNTNSIEYEITEPEPFTLRFEAERNGLINFREANVTVIKPFVPKEYNKIAMGVLSVEGDAAQVQWDYITHLMYASVQVSDDSGKLTLPDAAALSKLKTVVSLAHNEGVYVLIDITGPISRPTGSGFYNEVNFNNVAADPEKRKILIEDIKNFVSEYDLDGVNIYINNLNNDFGGLSNEDQLTAFMDELGEALPKAEDTERGAFFVTASVPQAWNNSEFSWLGAVKRLDWMNFMQFGSSDLSPIPHAADWNINDTAARFVSYGVPAEKILIGIGAFGIKYDIPAGTAPTWGTIDGFLSYFKYSEIVKMDPDAASKNWIASGTGGIFYVGVSAPEVSVQYKAQLARDNGCGGMFVWAVDYDTTDSATSLTQAVYKEMNP